LHNVLTFFPRGKEINVNNIYYLIYLSLFLLSCNSLLAAEVMPSGGLSSKDKKTTTPVSILEKRIDRLEESVKTIENKVENTMEVMENRFEEILKLIEGKHVLSQDKNTQEIKGANESEYWSGKDPVKTNVSIQAVQKKETVQTTSHQEKPQIVTSPGRIEKKILSLEEAVQDLQSRAAIMDMTEEVRRVEEYVCGNGHVYSTWSDDKRCPECGLKQKARDRFKKFKFARRESISERIEAVVSEAFEDKLVIGASGTSILQQVLSSDKEEKGFASGSFDLLFIAKPLLFTTFFADLEAIGGDGPDELFGSFSGLNDDSGSFQDDDGLDRISVREVWLQSFLLDQRLRLVGGKLDLTNYFDSNTVANDETTQFITSAFVNNPTLEVPDNGPGLVAFFDTQKGFNFGIGLQSADNSGTNISDDIFAIAEIGYRSHQFFGQEGNYRLWGKINGGKDNNKGLGISIDQNLSTRFTAFARYGANEEEKGDAEISSAWSLGMRYRSPFFPRVNDEIALAFGMLDIVGGGEESVAEFYYKFQLNDHFAISPSIQALFDPGGRGGDDTAGIAGIRTQIEF